MILYGYINEDGYLRTVEVEEKNITKQNDKGEFYNEVLTIEQQIEKLVSNGLKPVDIIDSDSLKSSSEFASVLMEPFDNGDRISYRYIEYFDRELVSSKINSIKLLLEESDYKIIKSYEATLLNLAPPYNIQELYKQRNNWRKDINSLKKMIE